MTQRILVAAPHPDDETLGCGGTLLKHKQNGDELFWLIATSSDYYPGFSEDQKKQRREQIKNVYDAFGFTESFQLNYPTTKLDQVPDLELTSAIAKIVKEVKPNVLYIPFSSDPHTDHQKIFQCSASCAKTFRYPFIKKVLMMEILSETDASISGSFAPNVYSDISPYFEKKLEIMSLYKSEMGQFPFPRSIEAITAQANFRGAAANCKFAESFMLVKEIF
jgi:LmbE family N-acetylglucosaminyl deacetylase